MPRRKLRLPLTELGRAHSRSGHAWIWECWVGACVADRTRKDVQLSRQAAEDCLVAHLRDHHGASGGEAG
jgi:hypothetical protein